MVLNIYRRECFKKKWLKVAKISKVAKKVAYATFDNFVSPKLVEIRKKFKFFKLHS